MFTTAQKAKAITNLPSNSLGLGYFGRIPIPDGVESLKRVHPRLDIPIKRAIEVSRLVVAQQENCTYGADFGWLMENARDLKPCHLSFSCSVSFRLKSCSRPICWTLCLTTIFR